MHFYAFTVSKNPITVNGFTNVHAASLKSKSPIGKQVIASVIAYSA